MAILGVEKGNTITGILPTEIENKKDLTNIGDYVRVPKWLEDDDGTYRTVYVKARVLEKYKHVVVTDVGSFQWKQLLVQKPPQDRRRTKKKKQQGGME